jgi:maleate cis-trans isomerase
VFHQVLVLKDKVNTKTIKKVKTMKTQKYQIKAIKRLTKNGKEIILPILVNVDDDSDVYFVNQGFSITLTIDQEEIGKLVETGKLYSKKLSKKTMQQVAESL